MKIEFDIEKLKDWIAKAMMFCVCCVALICIVGMILFLLYLMCMGLWNGFAHSNWDVLKGLGIIMSAMFVTGAITFSLEWASKRLQNKRL